jgi:hypothetical protein
MFHFLLLIHWRMVPEGTKHSGKKPLFCSARNLPFKTFPLLRVLFLLQGTSDLGSFYGFFGDISSVTHILQGTSIASEHSCNRIDLPLWHTLTTLRDSQNTPTEFRAVVCLERKTSTPPADLALPMSVFPMPEPEIDVQYISGKI